MRRPKGFKKDLERFLAMLESQATTYGVRVDVVRRMITYEQGRADLFRMFGPVYTLLAAYNNAYSHHQIGPPSGRAIDTELKRLGVKDIGPAINRKNFPTLRKPRLAQGLAQVALVPCANLAAIAVWRELFFYYPGFLGHVDYHQLVALAALYPNIGVASLDTEKLGANTAVRVKLDEHSAHLIYHNLRPSDWIAVRITKPRIHTLGL